jgi:hypothetical protein
VFWGSGGPNSVLLSVNVAAAIVTTPLARLSGPCQLVAITGVTVYFHCPAGTPLSVQLVPLIVPAQPDNVVCTTPVPEL